MKAQLRIDFEAIGSGKTVAVSGTLSLPNGQVADVTQDVMFCLGLLDYAKQLLWRKEQQVLDRTGPAVEIAPADFLNGKRQ